MCEFSASHLTTVIICWLKVHQGASLVVQRLRICLAMRETQVWSLLWEDPTCHRAPEGRRCSYWARAHEPMSHNNWSRSPGRCELLIDTAYRCWVVKGLPVVFSFHGLISEPSWELLWELWELNADFCRCYKNLVCRVRSMDASLYFKQGSIRCSFGGNWGIVTPAICLQPWAKTQCLWDTRGPFPIWKFTPIRVLYPNRGPLPSQE